MEDSSVDSIVTDPPYGLSFMGRKWDYDVPSVDIWKECLRVLKPGGHLLAFAGTRTQHRMAVNIEDAGFEIRDMIAWVYGSGFPKSLDVSKAIDKAASAEREVVGSKLGQPGYSAKKGGEVEWGGLRGDPSKECAITAPATPAAQQWSGWGTALKPALEPITVARKPFKGTVAANVLEHGTGAINIDGCRVGTGEDKGVWPVTQRRHNDVAWTVQPVETDTTKGRWPANLIHDGSDQVAELFPEQSSGSRAAGVRKGMGFHGADGDGGPAIQGSSGSAARFFYSPKVSKKERGEGNNHPTVKPIALMAYLCRLVTPPGGTVLDPFMGSGSTGIAALQEGFSFIGIEREPEYMEIAKQRIKTE